MGDKQISLGKYAPYSKAVAAAIALFVPFAGAIASGLADGALSLDEVTLIGTTFVAMVGGTKAVFQVSNKPAEK